MAMVRIPFLRKPLCLTSKTSCIPIVTPYNKELGQIIQDGREDNSNLIGNSTLTYGPTGDLRLCITRDTISDFLKEQMQR